MKLRPPGLGRVLAPGLRAMQSPLPRLVLTLLLVAVLGGCASLTPYSELRASLPAENLIEAGGQWVYVEDRAPVPAAPGTEAVVFLHGFGASSYSWRKVVVRLGGYRTVAFDLHGFGYTERPPGIAPYTSAGQVALIRDVLDRLDVDRAHLVGHSYGGALAMAFAERYPERLLSLVLVDPAHPDYPQLRRRRVAAWRPLTELYVRVWALRPELVGRALRSSIADDALVTPELVDAYLERLRVEGTPRAYYGITVPTPPDGPPVDLSGIEVPTLVVWGAEDTVIPIAIGRSASADLPCHRFVALEGAGHMPMEERPAELAAAIRKFLARPTAVCTAVSEAP